MQTSSLRLGLPQRPFFDSLDPEIARAIDAAILVLRKLTASVKEVVLPPTTIPLDQIFIDVRSVEVYAYHSQWLAEVPAKYGATTRQRLVENAADVQPSAYARSRRQLELLRRQIKTTFAAVDLLDLPFARRYGSLLGSAFVLWRFVFVTAAAGHVLAYGDPCNVQRCKRHLSFPHLEIVRFAPLRFHQAGLGTTSSGIVPFAFLRRLRRA